MTAPSSRTRSKIALNPSRIVSTSRLSVDLTARLILSNVLLVAALDAGKELLLPPDARLGVFWVLIRVLACAALGVLVREGLTGEMGKRMNARVEWSAVGTASLLLFVQQASLLTALYRVSALRVILFTHFASFWVNSLVQHGSVQKTIVLAGAFAFSFMSDANFMLSNIRLAVPGYTALIIHGLASSGLEHTQGVLSPSLGQDVTRMACTIGATVIALPFYVFKSLISSSPDAPALPLTSLIALPVLAFSLLYLAPNTTAQVRSTALPTQHYNISYSTTALAALILGPLAFSQFPSWTDCIVGALIFYGAAPDKEQMLTGPPRTPAIRLAKAYLKTILANPESRKIFYFLVLNLAYMLVQMLYGVWTNSLGLISDAIHMAFDCMAIGMGLLASVMATWPPNERFTYGYGRIETLSGFANGIFLILISIFIVFEAIQRILDPPEMNTNQLLLVSTLGLGVNLFGMFAMGGHHHHGHSHSHGHGHSHGNDSHSHSHSPSSPISPHLHSPELHVNDDGESSHEHGHSHSHSHGEHAPQHSSPTPTVYLSPEVCGEDHDHSHSHSHSHSPDHSHGHGHEHDHEHDHDRGHDHGHGHNSVPRYAFPTLASSAHHSQELPGNAPPMSAPATTARFHSRTMSLQVPSASSSLGPPPVPSSGHNHSHANGHSGHRHARTPSVAPIPTSAGFLSPDSFSSASPGSPGSAPPLSPLTPSYEFGRDAHFAAHHDHTHGGAHVPNLHDHSHAHGHGGEHEGHSHNMRGVFLHVMADTLGSVGVIISTLLIQFYGWTGFDPIASLFIAVLIVASVVPLVIDSGKVLCLDVGERTDNIERALAEVLDIDGLASYSAPRFWPKDASSLIGSIHIQLTPSQASVDIGGPHSATKTTWAPVDRVVERVDSILRNRISGLEELTIQVEGSNAS